MEKSKGENTEPSSKIIGPRKRKRAWTPQKTTARITLSGLTSEDCMQGWGQGGRQAVLGHTVPCPPVLLWLPWPWGGPGYLLWTFWGTTNSSSEVVRYPFRSVLWRNHKGRISRRGKNKNEDRKEEDQKKEEGRKEEREWRNGTRGLPVQWGITKGVSPVFVPVLH